jgi:Uri superfamily endonuclease
VLDIEDPYRGPGIYLLVLKFNKEYDVSVGSIGTIHLSPGYYGYIGSAKAGLWGRVKRHLSDAERKRWHIDHITGMSVSRKVYFKVHEEGGECRYAREFSSEFESVKGFGCSDCRCDSHLFYLGP